MQGMGRLDPLYADEAFFHVFSPALILLPIEVLSEIGLVMAANRRFA